MRHPPEAEPLASATVDAARGSSTLGHLVRRRQTQWMDRAPGAPIHASVVANAPLLRVGLERAALTAGLLLTSDQAAAAIGLHPADTAPTDASTDLSVGANQVTIALTAIPNRETWMAVWVLLGELFDVAAEAP
jgi:hypothetical protein